MFSFDSFHSSTHYCTQQGLFRIGVSIHNNNNNITNPTITTTTAAAAVVTIVTTTTTTAAAAAAAAAATTTTDSYMNSADGFTDIKTGQQNDRM